MLRKLNSNTARRPHLSRIFAETAGKAIDRRTFLKRSGLAATGLGLASLPITSVKRAEAAATPSTVEVKTSVCTFCAVGCAVTAKVKDGIWFGQEPAFDSPINLGGHCAKGAAIRDETMGDRRLKYPLKLVDGKWTRVSARLACRSVGLGRRETPPAFLQSN
jgi:formate dehydrogenase major subunit